MSVPQDEIPPGLQALFDAAGPILKYRILRDLCDQDESWIRTAQLGRELDKHPSAAELLSKRSSNGSWSGMLCGVSEDMFPRSTVYAMLRLFECARERHPLLIESAEKVLLPSLARDDLLWEYTSVVSGGDEKNLARRLIRDLCLRLLCRAARSDNELLRAQIEIILSEWKLFASGHDDSLPTRSGFAAVCWYPWEDDDIPRVRETASALFARLEGEIDRRYELPDWFAWHRLRLFPKELYLADPARLLNLLELTSRLGLTRDLPVTRWMLEELEIRQDADGMVRFEAPLLTKTLQWYFPIEAAHPEDYPIEYTFRALLIFKLLGYDF